MSHCETHFVLLRIQVYYDSVIIIHTVNNDCIDAEFLWLHLAAKKDRIEQLYHTLNHIMNNSL